MAIILQVCSARLGVVTGKDLAQAGRDFYPRWTRVPNWIGDATMATSVVQALQRTRPGIDLEIVGRGRTSELFPAPH